MESLIRVSFIDAFRLANCHWCFGSFIIRRDVVLSRKWLYWRTGAYCRIWFQILITDGCFWIVDTIDLLCICCCLIICLCFCRKGAEIDDTVGRQVCVDVNDSSDSVTDGEERFRLWDDCTASIALVAAFCFVRVGGSAFTVDVCRRTIGGALETVAMLSKHSNG